MSLRVLEAVIGKGDTYNSTVTPAKPSVTPARTLPRPKVEVFQSGRTSPSLSDTENTETPGTSVDGDVADEVISTILTKTRFDPADVEPFTRIADMGLDSILTIEVISELKSSVGLELPASFFNHYPTVADVRKALSDEDEPKAETPIVSAQSSQSTADISVTKNTKPISSYHSNVVLVQGRSKSKKTPLFLIADGAGSSMTYMHFPPLFSGDNPVYACESPFLDKPEEFTYTIEEVSDLYADAIRKIQPHGPYILGGWSLGGLYSFEVSKRFINAGEVVKGLFVLDFKFPAPSKAKNQIVPSMEMVEMIGVANGVNVPGKGFHLAPSTPKSKLHSLQSVRAAVKYVVDPMKPGRSPLNTYVVCGGQGLETLLGGIPAGIGDILEQEKLRSDPDNDTQAYTMLLWLFGKRKEQEGPDGWDVATQSEVHCSSLPCDYFFDG
ncbi:Alpha/Beta hydrolase protein [Trichoderma evansii]